MRWAHNGFPVREILPDLVLRSIGFSWMYLSRYHMKTPWQVYQKPKQTISVGRKPSGIAFFCAFQMYATWRIQDTGSMSWLVL